MDETNTSVGQSPEDVAKNLELSRDLVLKLREDASFEIAKWLMFLRAHPANCPCGRVALLAVFRWEYQCLFYAVRPATLAELEAVVSTATETCLQDLRAGVAAGDPMMVMVWNGVPLAVSNESPTLDAQAANCQGGDA